MHGDGVHEAAFTNNMIPASRLATLPVAQSFESYLPNPTAAGYVNNYSSPLKRAIADKNTTIRMDYNINQAHQLYGVFAYGKWSTDYTGNLTPTERRCRCRTPRRRASWWSGR